MGQKITVDIYGRKYDFTANSPEDEEIYRKAAASVNELIYYYAGKFPGKAQTDHLVMAALNASIGKVALEKKIERIDSEVKTLGEQTDAYLENIEGQPSAITR